ncbi:MAG: hypothetical protein QW291_03695 [Thermofilaceae archaeon]
MVKERNYYKLYRVAIENKHVLEKAARLVKSFEEASRNMKSVRG